MRFYTHGLSLLSACFACLAIATLAGAAFADEQPQEIDASDPTKIYTFVGAGPKYTDYTNNEHMLELRVSGNIGFPNDMVFFEAGYGKNSADDLPGSSSGFTNARVRWFHLFDMDYSIMRGYRGWATQLDLQIAGEVRGTDGQNVLSAGGVLAYGLNEKLSLFVAMSAVNTWDKKFKDYNGFGLNLAPLLVYTPDNWWPGAYVQFWPGYTRFISGKLDGEGSGNLDLTIGGRFTPTLLWSLLLQKNLDKDLRSFRRGRDTGLENDWNAFFNVTRYF